MLIENPLTVNTDIARFSSASSSLLQANTETKTNYNELISDSVNISSLGIESFRKDKRSQSTNHIELTSNEAVSINSTIGRSKSTNNLNHIQAKELYNKIASLL
jgi:hypothetical protein